MGEGYTLLSRVGEPTLLPRAATALRNESIFFYPHAWVAIVQEDGAFEVCRMD